MDPEFRPLSGPGPKPHVHCGGSQGDPVSRGDQFPWQFDGVGHCIGLRRSAARRQKRTAGEAKGTATWQDRPRHGHPVYTLRIRLQEAPRGARSSRQPRAPGRRTLRGGGGRTGNRVSCRDQALWAVHCAQNRAESGAIGCGRRRWRAARGRRTLGPPPSRRWRGRNPDLGDGARAPRTHRGRRARPPVWPLCPHWTRRGVGRGAPGCRLRDGPARPHGRPSHARRSACGASPDRALSRRGPRGPRRHRRHPGGPRPCDRSRRRDREHRCEPTDPPRGSSRRGGRPRRARGGDGRGSAPRSALRRRAPQTFWRALPPSRDHRRRSVHPSR